MDLQLKLSQKQVQKLILSPQMQQALHLLQLPLMELKQLIQKELLQNPLLEEADLSLNPSSVETTLSEEDMAKIDKALDMDIDWKEYYHDVSDLGTTEVDEEKREYMQASITRAPSLQKHLLDQLYLNVEDERQRGIGEFIIGNINDDGYLESTLFEVATSFVQEETELENLLSKLESAGFKSTPEKLLRYLKNLHEEAKELEKYLLWKLAESNMSDDDLHIASLILQHIEEDGTLQPTWQMELKKEAQPEHLEDVLGMLRQVEPGIASDAPLDPTKIEKDLEKVRPAIRIIDEHIKGIVEEAEQLLNLVQSFDPPGVGARDLKECLLIQLRARGEGDSLAAKIVQEHLEDLEHYKFKDIAKALGVSVEEVKEAAEQIRTLQPKPGHMFDSEPPQYIIPDVILEKVDGQYQIILNDEEIPTLRISPAYRELLKEDSNVDEKTRDYVLQKLKSALWLIKSIEQRKRTIYKVTECIVRHQREFLEKGIEYLRPLTLKDVAEMVNIHESTVSRVTSNKYIQTPRGIFELKFFFSGGLPARGNSSVSAKSIKAKIRQLIANEDPAKPLNDQKIADILKAEGVKIARRTVAKYREEMGILPANLRKRAAGK